MNGSWRITDDTAFVVSNPERVVLLNLATTGAQPIALLGTGAGVWRALIGTAEDLRPWVSQEHLLQQLAAGYGTEGAVIEPDVTALLRQLAAGGYVAVRPLPQAPTALSQP